MDSRPKPMALFRKKVVLLFTVLIGAARSQLCSLEAAKDAVATRFPQIDGLIEDPTAEEKYKTLCLTQIRKDSIAVKFEDALKLCTNAEVDILQAQWAEVNLRITSYCEQVCPNFLELPKCKNMTFLEEIEFSKYERFCETFQQSIECANIALKGCKFSTLYGDILEPKVMSYWRYICKSGCVNIDETVAVITACLEPFKEKAKSQLCVAHYEFKECVRQNKTVCPEMLALVRFIYRKYNYVDKVCTTTTTVTTTPDPETTVPFTETTEVTTSNQGITSTLTELSSIRTSLISKEPEVTQTNTKNTTTFEKTNPTKPSKILNATETITKTTLNENSLNVKIEDCLSAEDLEVISSATINVDSVLVFLKLESCLHNTSKDSATIEVIRASFPHDIRAFHSRIRSEGWFVAKQTLQEQSRCKGEELNDDCSGHGYGLIYCNSVGILEVSPTMVYISMLLTSFYVSQMK